MAINASVPVNVDLLQLQTAIQQILRRAVDGTVVPLFVDYTNQRVIIGATATDGNNSTVQVQVGDIEVTTAGVADMRAGDNLPRQNAVSIGRNRIKRRWRLTGFRRHREPCCTLRQKCRQRVFVLDIS